MVKMTYINGLDNRLNIEKFAAALLEQLQSRPPYMTATNLVADMIVDVIDARDAQWAECVNDALNLPRNGGETTVREPGEIDAAIHYALEEKDTEAREGSDEAWLEKLNHWMPNIESIEELGNRFTDIEEDNYARGYAAGEKNTLEDISNERSEK